MKRRDGTKAESFCFIWSNWIAPAIALAVKLPSCPGCRPAASAAAGRGAEGGRRGDEAARRRGGRAGQPRPGRRRSGGPAAALPASAAPEPTGPGGVPDSALFTVISTVGDDVFSTTDLTSLIDPTGARTQHYGPYASGSPDSGTCGPDWANDTFDRHFTV